MPKTNRGGKRAVFRANEMPDVRKQSVLITNVTEEYTKKITPGRGVYVIEPGFKPQERPSEKRFSEWMLEKLGGDIVVRAESDEVGVKNPDFLWNGKLWDLKETTTGASANSAIRSGIEQIVSNPGGVFLDYRNNDFSWKELEAAIKKRLHYSGKFDFDIMVVKNGKIAKVYRYTK